jgi:hypothetical protein
MASVQILKAESSSPDDGHASIIMSPRDAVFQLSAYDIAKLQPDGQLLELFHLDLTERIVDESSALSAEDKEEIIEAMKLSKNKLDDQEEEVSSPIAALLLSRAGPRSSDNGSSNSSSSPTTVMKHRHSTNHRPHHATDHNHAAHHHHQSPPSNNGGRAHRQSTPSSTSHPHETTEFL